MNVKDIKLKNIEDILEIWKEFGGHVSNSANSERILSDLKKAVKDAGKINSLQDGYRIGSKFSTESKLSFRIDYSGRLKEIVFDANLPSYFYKDSNHEAFRAEKEFSKKIHEYLSRIESASK